jgi:hypothetical protein
LLIPILAACNFNAAFSRYCQNNPHCVPDAGRGPEVRPAPPPDLGPDLGRDVGLDLRPDLGPDLIADAFVGPGRADSGATRPPGSCTSPADCNVPMETCHPSILICMPTCRSPADCPSGLDVCIEARGQPGDPNPPAKICACSGSQVCGQLGPNFRCNRLDNLCQSACYSTADCSFLRPSRLCDTFTNACVECVTSDDCLKRSDGRTECFPPGRCMPPAS